MVWGFSVNTTINHTFLSTPACTDIVYSKELECEVTTTAMAKAILRLKLWHHSFLHRFDFLAIKGRIRALMYMPCVKCSCSELKLAKHLHIFFVLT